MRFWSRTLSYIFFSSGAGVAGVNNQLYAVGGYDGSRHLYSTESYSACADEWMDLKDMNSTRCYVGEWGAIHNSELDRSEIDLSPKRSECERSNANWDRSKIDLNECEHFLKANWNLRSIQLTSILVWTESSLRHSAGTFGAKRCCLIIYYGVWRILRGDTTNNLVFSEGYTNNL